MTFPAITAFYAALLALIYVGLSMWVIVGRVDKSALFGDGGDGALARRIRAHANFIEYVPMAIVVIALFEAAGGGAGLVRGLMIALIVVRLMHPIGMFAKANTPPQFLFRGLGIVGTLAIIAVAAVGLIVRTS